MLRNEESLFGEPSVESTEQKPYDFGDYVQNNKSILKQLLAVEGALTNSQRSFFSEPRKGSPKSVETASYRTKRLGKYAERQTREAWASSVKERYGIDSFMKEHEVEEQIGHRSKPLPGTEIVRSIKPRELSLIADHIGQRLLDRE